MSATNHLRRHVWWVVTAVVVVSVFLTTFAAIRALGGPQSPLDHPVVRSTATDSQRSLTPAPASAPPSAEPALSLAPAPPGHSLLNGGAIEPPIPIVESAEGAAIERVPVVVLPPIDEAALILGGTGSEGAILAGPGIVPSSGPRRQTSWELLVPAARIKAALVRVGITAAGALGAPDNPFVVGWWESGPPPGQAGNLLLAGHRDFQDVEGNLGTGAAWYLPEVEAGDVVLIRELAGGLTYVYTVVETVSMAWNDPAGASYLQSSTGARLTLITCEGAFDTATRHYANRRIVIAEFSGLLQETT